MWKVTLMLLLVTLLVTPEVDAWRWRKVARWVKAGVAVAKVVGRRDVSATADLNNDGFVDPSELSNVLGERATMEEIRALLDAADEDEDGKVHRRELDSFLDMDD